MTPPPTQAEFLLHHMRRIPSLAPHTDHGLRHPLHPLSSPDPASQRWLRLVMHFVQDVQEVKCPGMLNSTPPRP